LVENWRPLFQLLFYTSEFRVLLVDTLKILRQVLLRHQEGLGDYAEQKFVEGASPAAIAKTVTKEIKDSFQTPEGELQVEITDDEWDQLNDNIARVFVTLSRQPSYRDGIQRMFNLLDLLRDQLTTARVEASATVQPHARRAQVETEELIAKFAGREALDDFIESLCRLVEKTINDEQTKEYLRELREFILDTGEHIHEEEFKRRSKELASRGRQLVQDKKYEDELNHLFDCANTLMENIQNDEFVTVLRHHAGLVADDLSYLDTEGRVQVDTEMLGKLRSVIVPVLAETLKYIPIPRIEDSNDNRDYWFDNIILCGYDVIPNNIRFQIESDSEVSLRDVETQKSSTKMIITLKEIRTELKNMDFFYHKKTFPEMTEQGRVTLRLTGDGATLKMIFQVKQGPEDKVPKLGEGEVHFQIHTMDIEFDKESLKHDILVPMLTGMMKNQIQIKN